MSRVLRPGSPPEIPIPTSSDKRQTYGINSQHIELGLSSAFSSPYASASGQDPQSSTEPDAVGAIDLPLLTPSFRPDESSPPTSNSPARYGMITDPATFISDDDDGDIEGDNDSGALPESGTESADGDGIKVSIPEETFSPPVPPLQTTRERPAGWTSGSASPSYTPGGSRIKPGSARRPSMSTGAGQTLTHLLIIEAALIIEEVSDFDSDNGRIQILRPYEIEEADSEREKTADPNRNRRGKFNMAKVRRRSSARLSRLPELDRGVMSGLREFTFGADSDEEVLLDEDDDDSDYDEDALKSFLLKQRNEKRRRRMTSGSISKRTITESIGSDTDTEDLSSMLDASDVGSSARRLRRRLDRHSLQFQDPPPPRIDELDEPDTSDNEDDVKELIHNGETLARELPYYTLEYISMEVDSP
ncbi:hypothetical protein SEPCBS57363_003878 [Sporothrix epigloea]|uniref:Uncharacterized protein n=1 Tax=Sporothrix epigloea TaxID=1892477 RepID=A0ABP0DR26_9PEZI